LETDMDFQTPKRYEYESCYGKQFGPEFMDMPRDFHSRMARNMLAGIFRHQGQALLSRKRLSAAEINTDIE
jgi:hypothetical protein